VCSILAVATIFDNTNNSRNFHGIHRDLSMDSHVDLFHGIQGGYASIPHGIQWNPYGMVLESIWN
jgi:hypothetical protein